MAFTINSVSSTKSMWWPRSGRSVEEGRRREGRSGCKPPLLGLTATKPAGADSVMSISVLRTSWRHASERRFPTAAHLRTRLLVDAEIAALRGLRWQRGFPGYGAGEWPLRFPSMVLLVASGAAPRPQCCHAASAAPISKAKRPTGSAGCFRLRGPCACFPGLGFVRCT